MKKIELLRFLENEAIDYRAVAAQRIKKNQLKRSSLVKINEIEAVVSDLINFIGERMGIEYGLHRTHLKAGNKLNAD